MSSECCVAHVFCPLSYFSPKLLAVYTDFLFPLSVSLHACHCDILRGTVPLNEPEFQVYGAGLLSKYLKSFCSCYCNGDDC